MVDTTNEQNKQLLLLAVHKVITSVDPDRQESVRQSLTALMARLDRNFDALEQAASEQQMRSQGRNGSVARGDHLVVDECGHRRRREDNEDEDDDHSCRSYDSDKVRKGLKRVERRVRITRISSRLLSEYEYHQQDAFVTY